MRIAFFGSSLLSSYWNGAATYYRGIISSLHRLGCRTTFYEPDAFDRQAHRDIDPPEWADVVVYPANGIALAEACRMAAGADVVVKASGIGVLDSECLERILARPVPHAVRVFWDVDAPATLQEISETPSHYLRAAIPRLDAVFTYGGGPTVVREYERLGARLCLPVYNALDPCTHHPIPRDDRFHADLSFLGNRLPDREARVEEFLLAPARTLKDRRFLLAGAGWEPGRMPENVRMIGHVSTRDHNAFNSSPLAVLNVARDSMARVGYSPATRIFEAAGAGACIITDTWEGIEVFLEPGSEILVARSGTEVASLLATLTADTAAIIGRRALARVRRDHTYDQRARLVLDVLERQVRRNKSSTVPRMTA